MLKELSIVEQRYQAVLAVIADGEPIRAVAEGWGVSRQTVHAWLTRYEAGGLGGLADRSHRTVSCPHQMAAGVEAQLLELRRVRPWWGPRRLRHELAGRQPRLVEEYGLPSESAVYRCLVRAGLIEPDRRRRRAEKFKRWERGRPMELWQLDVIGGFGLADGTSCKALTGIDDHSRMCVSARLMVREQTRPVCDGLAAALQVHGVPQQVLTDNGRVFTGRFHHPPVEVLFDRICRENGIEHLLTRPRSPTTTGKIERFHRTLRAEFDTRRVFASMAAAQAELDAWVDHYNHRRPHQALDMATPAQRFARPTNADHPGVARDAHLDGAAARTLDDDRCGDGWVSRRVGGNGVVSVSWQQVSVGKHRAGRRVDVLVGHDLLQFYDGDELLKTVTRTSRGEVRKKRATRA